MTYEEQVAAARKAVGKLNHAVDLLNEALSACAQTKADVYMTLSGGSEMTTFWPNETTVLRIKKAQYSVTTVFIDPDGKPTP